MFSQDVIEPTQTEWTAPIVFTSKKDGLLRYFVDYRKLNNLTRHNSYAIPRMGGRIGLPEEVTVLPILDANSGYWQVENEEEDREESAITYDHGLYCFVRTPFGLKNVLGTF